jgi:signal transduction histidine kinase
MTEKIDELSAMAERERRITADMAHDLRTPLTSMAALATVIGDQVETAPPDLRRPLELLIESIDRMRDLTVGLLELARLDASSATRRVEPLPVVPAIMELLDEFGQHPAIVVEGEPCALADRERFRRVVRNLVENAVVHGGGVVRVHVRLVGDRCRIDIDDDGDGIAPAEIERIFERFHKADPSRSTTGSGLGLAIAREHARGQRGTLRAENLRRGARFTFELPGAVDVATRSVN